MILIKNASRLAFNRLIMTPVSTFARDFLDDRDQAAEKVYINRKESMTFLNQGKH